MKRLQSVFNVKNTVRNFAIIVFAVVFTVMFTSCSKDNPDEPEKRRFVTQASNPNDQMCGAYCLAFYKWLKAGKTYSENEAEDRSEVQTIYNQVVFGSAYSNVSVMGIGVNLSMSNNPIKMLDFSVETLGKNTARLYYDSNTPALVDIKNAIETNDAFLMAKHSERIFTAGIPVLNSGQYAIVLFLVVENWALHWILFHNTGNGLAYYDPYFGEARTATDAQMRGVATLQVAYFNNLRTLQSLNSCLFLE